MVEDRKGDIRFLQLLDQMEELHARKQADYGKDHDPFANVRAATEWGVEAWVGAAIRMSDKFRRLQTYAETGVLQNEGVEDAFMDLAVYSLIGLILWQEEHEPALNLPPEGSKLVRDRATGAPYTGWVLPGIEPAEWYFEGRAVSEQQYNELVAQDAVAPV